MYARISTIEGDPGKVDDAIATINEKVIPTLKGLAGFKSATFMVDRSAGKLVGIAYWETEAALKDSGETVHSSRSEVADSLGGKIVSVESYELFAET
jgi:hypothetical protein